MIEIDYIMEDYAMFRFLKKGFSMLLIFCLLQSFFVPSAVTATADPVVYDFYTSYKNYKYLYHWRPEYIDESAQNQIASDYASGASNWDIQLVSGYIGMTDRGYVPMYMGANASQVIRFRSPGTGNYEVDINYATTNRTGASRAAEFYIIPLKQASYTSQEISDLMAQNKPLLRLSCYDASSTNSEKTATVEYSFLADQEYFFVVNGGSAGGEAYMRNLTARWVGEYNPPAEPEYPRPVTILEEALYRWEDNFYIVDEVNGYDYFALPIYGGKMYIFNLDTWELVDEVNTGIDVPRGITADDEGVIYLSGTGYSLYTYDLKTNKTGKTSNFNGNGVSFGSLYDIHYGDDGKLYFGSNKGHIFQYDPNTDTFNAIKPDDYGISDASYVASVLQSGQYIYAAVTNNQSRHYLVKVDKDTLSLAGVVEYTETNPSTYMSNMSITIDGIILAPSNKLLVIDTNEMRMLTAEEFGSNAKICGYASEAINGKHYYVGSYIDEVTKKEVRNLYCYDPDANDGEKVTVFTGLWQFLDCQGKTVTGDKDGDGVEETYLLTVEQPNQYGMKLVNAQTGDTWQRDIQELLPENAGAGTGVNSLTNGPAGSNELYFGGFTSNQVIVYNTNEGKITGQLTAAGIQTDAIYVDGNTIYGGNYTEAQLTRLHPDTNKPEVLMTLHNSLFNQSRIHSITGGDNKIFFGTFPYVYKYGGVIAWYDLTTNRSYVAVGPNPEDVYYANYEDTKYNYTANKPTVPVSTVKWYNEITGEQLTGFDEWKGIIDYQGVKEVAYHNGILYAATSREGGTNASPVAGTSAVIVAYDVNARQVIATFDPITQGFAGPVPTISGIEVDENGTLWCIVSETLFTLTLDEDNTFTYAEKLSFDKCGYDGTQNRSNSDIRFKDGYVYAAFERIGGLCKINMANPNDYTNLLPYVNTNGQIPDSFALGEDGNLYFLLGTSLKMVALDPTEGEWTEARKVTEMISAVADKRLSATRQAYEALTTRQKSLVQNYEILIQAEAAAFVADIDALGNITWADYDQVKVLLARYQKMPKAQQNLITNHYVLTNANQTLQMIDRSFSVAVRDPSGHETYYQTLEKALAETTKGTIYLYEDVAAGTVVLNPGITLDLNGKTLTADLFVAMQGAVVLDGGEACVGGGALKIEKNNLVLPQDNDSGVIAIWNGVDGYVFTRVSFQQMAKSAGNGAVQYIFLPRFSNAEAAALLVDGGVDNELKIQICMTWNDGKSQQFYSYRDDLVKKVFDGTNRWVFDLKITGAFGIPGMDVNAKVVTECGTQASSAATNLDKFLVPSYPDELQSEMGFAELNYFSF